MAFLDAHLGHLGLAGDVRPGMGHALYQLLDEDDLTLKELSGRARLAQSTMTGIVAQIEERGLVERRRDERDGRAYRLRLTAKGRALAPRLRALDRRCTRVFRAALGPDEIAALKGMLDRLHVALTTPAHLGIGRRAEPGGGRVRRARATRRMVAVGAGG
jgi:DNA-binding MarR family transcriptional regulator